MVNYTNNEYMDMIIIYGASGENAARARRMYLEKFPNRHTPSENTFLRVIQRGRETGNLQPKKGHDGGRPHRHGVDLDEEVLERVDAEPTISTRLIAKNVNASHNYVWRILKMNGLHPYHFQKVQGLTPNDYPLRQQFCEWLLNNLEEGFPQNVLVTDECCFSRNGSLNFHNAHIWTDENPRAIRQSNFQQRFSLNLWAGIVNETLIGPFELPARLNGESYLHFLQEELPGFLEDVPLLVRRNMWFMHDGCPAHVSHPVREHLDRTFPQRWIGRGGFIQWPPRSPDLNPMDFFLWGHLKDRVYATEVDNIDELRHRINIAVEALRQHFPPVSRDWIYRAQMCVEKELQHF